MPARASAEDLARQARFVFHGTVQQLNAATMPEVTNTDRTAVVRIDDVIQAPAEFADYAGKDITVLLSGRRKLAAGDQAVFFTNGWLYGESLAVQSIGERPPPRTAATLSRRVGDPAQTLADRDRQAHVEDADAVVLGTVTSVGLPPERVSAIAAAQPAMPTKPSEHDALWQEATVQVTGVEKGTDVPHSIVVRYAASKDIAWRHAPKLRPGQEGRFILHKAEVAHPTAAAGAAPREVYTALHPTDFQPWHELEDVTPHE